LQLSTREGVDRPLEQMWDGEGKGYLLDRARSGGGRIPAHLQG
jgi:hypothetical protein